MENLNTNGHILLVNEPLEYATAYMQDKNPQNYKLFCANELSIDIARAIIDECYIANENTKTIVIAANSYNIPAQNALLKILEEPPSGIVFLLLTQRKLTLLPTIRSRLPLVNQFHKEKLPSFALDIATLNLQKIYTYLKEKQKDFNNPHLKEEIQSLYLDCVKLGINFTPNQAQMFEEAILWSTQYEKPHYIFLPLLLMILEKRNQNLSLGK